MWSLTVLIASFALSKVALAAKYNIELYPESGCGGSAFVCNDMKSKRYCSDGGNKYHAAKVTESGSDTCDDQLRIYKTQDKDYCGFSLGQNDDASCISAGSREVTGATVYVTAFKRDDEPFENVAPDEYVYENITARTGYSIKLDSPEGRAIKAMKSDRDRIEYAVRFGEPKEIVAVDKRDNCERLGGGKDKIIKGAVPVQRL